MSHGIHATEEILSQPACWKNCLDHVKRFSEETDMLSKLNAASSMLFIGCGSSYYIALAAAASWKRLTGKYAYAVPASELLLFPDQVLQEQSKWVPVLISRSGHTSEIVQSAKILKEKRVTPTIGITCTSGQQLQRLADTTIELLPAGEESTIMTRSFTSMLLALQYLAALDGGKSEIIAALESLPGLSARVLPVMSSAISKFVDANNFSNCIFLGQGLFLGIAREACLKVTEMSCSFAQSFHSLEFRHGPKSMVEPGTMICSFISESGYTAESKVLQEMKVLGALTVAITNRSDQQLQGTTDLLLEMRTELPEVAWLAPSAFAGQLLGLHIALKKKLDPDHPRNLSQVVILED